VTAAAPPTGLDAAAREEAHPARCRNCGSATTGAFCAQCGQETELRLPTLREFLREAAGRYVAFDGRFWRTMIALAFRPGRLTREYFAGRRRRYIRPARLYLFATLIFFAVTRFAVEPEQLIKLDEKPAKTSAKKAESTKNAFPENASPKGSGRQVASQIDVDTTADAKEKGVYFDDDLHLHVPDALPGAYTLKSRWERFERLPNEQKQDQIVDGVLRYGPYAMFALLPAFALLLKFVYLGRYKRYPGRPRLYGEHLVFATHDHAFFFVAATAALLLPSGVLRAIVILWMVVYLFLSLRRTYGGSRTGTVLRAGFLFFSYATLIALASAGLVVAAVLLR
jgi:Protein of unknown function (DUF3667)